MMGLGRREPSVGHQQPPTLLDGLVGQGRADPADPGLGDVAPKRASAHPAAHRGNVEVLHDDSAVAAGQRGGEGVQLVGAEVRRSPVKGG
jgi:hypothetical protein